MRFTTGIALLLGLSARILYNKFFLGRLTPGIEDHVLSGLWQGVALYYFIMEHTGLAFGVAFGMAGRILANLILYRDAMQCACTLLGIAVGVFLTDLLSQVLEDGQEEEYASSGYDGSVSDVGPRPRRLVQLRKVSSETSHHRRAKYNSRRRREFLEYTPSTTTNVTEVPSDTTQSLESLADWIDPNHRLSPLEREVAALRRKATIADSERRRFKEERKWAQEQGNTARANQMGWQVKRYAALMQSFHREADLRLLETSNKKHREEINTMRTAMSQIGGPTSTVAPSRWVPPSMPTSIPAPMNGASSLPPLNVVAAPSPPPRPVPAPIGPSDRQTILKPSAIPTRQYASRPSASSRPRRSSLVNRDRDRDRERERALEAADVQQLPPGSSHTGHHQHRKTTSILSRPSVRIEDGDAIRTSQRKAKSRLA